jgi:hypothetical protein
LKNTQFNQKIVMSTIPAERFSLESPKTNLEELLEPNELNSQEIFNFNRDIDSNNNKIKELLCKTNILSTKDRELLADLLWNPLTYFNDLLKQNRFSEVMNQHIRNARNKHIAILQRIRLLIGDRDEVSIALLWMGERGEQQEDLIAIKNFHKNLTITPSEIQSLAESVKSVEESITQYLKLVDRMPKHYRVGEHPTFYLVTTN